MAKLLDYLRSVVIAIFLAYVVQLLVVRAYKAPASSHGPARFIYDFVENDHYLALKLTYLFSSPARGDLVLFDSPESNFMLVSRVVGLPGETLEIRNGTVLINGTPLQEDYLIMQFPYDYSIQLAPDAYFVLADNRVDGVGSTTWGPIGAREITGKAWLRYWPVTRMTFISSRSVAR